MINSVQDWSGPRWNRCVQDLRSAAQASIQSAQNRANVHPGSTPGYSKILKGEVGLLRKMLHWDEIPSNVLSSHSRYLPHGEFGNAGAEEPDAPVVRIYRQPNTISIDSKSVPLTGNKNPVNSDLTVLLMWC